jgi:hypothetical protein
VKDIRRYIKLRPSGEAFAPRPRVVLLIDEVDKADLEFPNDLLHELDRMRFRVERDRRRGRRQAAPRRDHHQQQREGAARRLPPPLRLPLHRLPRRLELMRRIVACTTRARRARSLEQCCRCSTRSADAPHPQAPQTSELVDWIAVLQARGHHLGEARPRAALPRALLKKEQDLVAFADQLAGGRKFRS